MVLDLQFTIHLLGDVLPAVAVFVEPRLIDDRCIRLEGRREALVRRQQHLHWHIAAGVVGAVQRADDRNPGVDHHAEQANVVALVFQIFQRAQALGRIAQSHVEDQVVLAIKRARLDALGEV